MTERRQTILAIDPGTTASGVVRYDGRQVLESFVMTNDDLLLLLRAKPSVVVCELIQCLGMPVGAEVFQTAYLIGSIMEIQRGTQRAFHGVYRSQVKLHLCGTARAKDANIRQALIDLHGGKDKAIGRKKTPGPLYSVSGHCWQALAVAVTWWHTTTTF
jgi:hypothetical protein